MANAEGDSEAAEEASAVKTPEVASEEDMMASPEAVDLVEVPAEGVIDLKMTTNLIGADNHLMMAMKKKPPVLPGDQHLKSQWSQQTVGPMSRVLPPPKKISHPRSKEEVLCGAQQQ
jgi:hypothetical protein